GQVAGMAAAAPGWCGLPGLFDAGVRLTLFRPPLPSSGSPAAAPPLSRVTVELWQQFLQVRDDSPPALLYLAIRAARRALAVNPEDSQAYLVLGEGYLRLLRSTRERVWAQKFPELGQLRRAQATAALHRAVALQPDIAQAHLDLGGIYAELGYWDLVLQHRQAYVKLARQAGPPAGVSLADFRSQLAEREQDVDRLATAVAEQEAAFNATAPSLRVFDRADLARQRGLGGKARDILLQSDIAAFGSQGMALELQLLLETGRAKEVREWTDPGQKEVLGASYHWLRIQALAAEGDYALAEDECMQLASDG